MRVEIPECRRCCCCFPLRRGILVFGYINLSRGLSCVLENNYYLSLCLSVKHYIYKDNDNLKWPGALNMKEAYSHIFSIFVVLLEVFISYKHYYGSHTMAFYKGVSFYSQNWFALILYTTDIVFNIILLVGAHRKKTRLLRAFYYYGITTTLASLVTFVVVRLEDLYDHFLYFSLEAAFVFCNLASQVYLLLLIRSELLKIRQSSRFCYVNHATEIIVDAPTQTGRNPF